MGKPIRKQELESKFIQLLTEIRDLEKTNQKLYALIKEDYVSESIKKILTETCKSIEIESVVKMEKLNNYFIDISISTYVFIGLKKYNCLGRVTNISTTSKQFSVILEPPVIDEWDITDEIDVADLAEVIVFVVAKEE